MREPDPVHPDAEWLYQPGMRTHPHTLTQQLLMQACVAAANELGIRRRRTPAQRELLAENTRQLLFEVANREQDGVALGSMSWDLSHGRLSLVEAAERALEAERSRSRYRVLQWALKAALGDNDERRRDHQLLITHEGRQVPISVLALESDAGHATAIAALQQLQTDMGSKSTGQQ